MGLGLEIPRGDYFYYIFPPTQSYGGHKEVSFEVPFEILPQVSRFSSILYFDGKYGSSWESYFISLAPDSVETQGPSQWLPYTLIFNAPKLWGPGSSVPIWLNLILGILSSLRENASLHKGFTFCSARCMEELPVRSTLNGIPA